MTTLVIGAICLLGGHLVDLLAEAHPEGTRRPRALVARVRSEVGFSPRVDLASGVRESIAWHRSTRPARA